MKSCVPPPVMLNGWKHHLGFVISQLRKLEERNPDDFEGFVQKLKMLGGSQFDLYTGSLSPGEIGREALLHLKNNPVLNPDAYKSWLKAGQAGYREAVFSDKSTWTFLEGDDETFFIHIHPSRYSKHSRRVKANNFRSALAVLAYAFFQRREPGLEMLNYVRHQYLGLPVLPSVFARSILETSRFILAEGRLEEKLKE